MKKVGFYSILVLGFLWTMVMTTPAWAAYSSHQNDQDINNFLAVYPFARSTKLDDCSLCHPGGKIGSKTYGSCDYCHQTYGLKEPHQTHGNPSCPVKFVRSRLQSCGEDRHFYPNHSKFGLRRGRQEPTLRRFKPLPFQVTLKTILAWFLLRSSD